MLFRSFKNMAFMLGLVIVIGGLTNCSNTLPEDVARAYQSLPEKIDYNFHVKPILSDRCYQCHGPDDQSRKAGLRLDIEDEAFKKLSTGNFAFVKGSISGSTAMHRMTSDDPSYRMPPPESSLEINSEEIAIIAKWLDQGAEWKPHWSFIPLEAPAVPEVKNDWKRTNPIDNFVQQKLIEKELIPASGADKERLLRRVNMDLTGLPPTIAEIDAFLEDQSGDAYEKVVDRLLQTEAHAEHMAMQWMDIARYADSHGISFDGYRTSWPYRDWLIEAFQQNMPYDQFIINQVAGDLVDNANENTKLGTAFYRMNPLEGSAGSIPEEFRIEYISERTGITGTAFLGLTIECARCHDHKFDPISQKEFYQVSAFFNNTEEFGLAPADADRPPTMMMLSDTEKIHLDSMIQALMTEERNYKNTFNKKKQEAASKKLADFQDDIPGRIGHYSFETIATYKKEIKKPKEKKGKKEYTEIQFLDDDKKVEAKMGVTLVDGKQGRAPLFNEEYDLIHLREIGEFEHVDPFSISTWVNTKKVNVGSSQTIIGNAGHVLQFNRGWEMALDSSNHVSVRFIHRLPDEVILVKSEVPVAANEWNQVGFTYDGSSQAIGIDIYINGRKVAANIHEDKLKRSMVPIDLETMKPDTIPLQVGKSRRLWMEDLGMFSGAIDEISIFNRRLSQLEMARLGENIPDPIAPAMSAEHWALQDSEIENMQQSLKNSRIRIGMALDSAGELMIMEEMATPRKTYLLERGLYDQRGEEVQPGGIETVLAFSESLPRNRLGLAKWLTDADNPLVSRVAINRYWQMIFGQGLVKTSENFGSQGERPTHPELLDWLALNFIESGWDIDASLKLMVMSSTYRQSSFAEQEKREKDPQNTYLSRGSSYRWPAEIIRDNVLAASGLLVNKVGGPSVKPYQPQGLWEELGGTSKKLEKYVRDSLENLYRRSLYTFVRRFAPNPFMATFDASSREICIIRRDVTNSPLQALTLLNDPQIIEASRILSERVQTEAEDTINDQLSLTFRLSTGLKPSDKQLSILLDHYNTTLLEFIENPAMADSLLSIGDKPVNPSLGKEKTAALALVASTIFNFDEVYMKR